MRHKIEADLPQAVALWKIVVHKIHLKNYKNQNYHQVVKCLLQVTR